MRIKYVAMLLILIMLGACSKASHEIALTSSTDWVAIASGDTIRGSGNQIFRVPQNGGYCVTAYKTTDYGSLRLELFVNQGGLSSGRTRVEAVVVYLRGVPATICKN